MKLKKKSPLLKHLADLERASADGKLNLRDVFNVFGQDGHHVLILFMTLPLLQPVPLFVLSTPFGILTAVAAYCYFKKIEPWLPKSWENKTLPARFIGQLTLFAERVLLKFERFVHPRWPMLFSGPFAYINLVLTILMAVLLALPLPIPLSNAIPAWMIFFQAFGHLERDGAMIVLSYVQSILCLVFFGLVFSGAQIGWEWFKTLGV